MKPPLMFPTCKGCSNAPTNLNDPPCRHPECLKILMKLTVPFPQGCHFAITEDPVYRPILDTSFLEFPDSSTLDAMSFSTWSTAFTESSKEDKIHEKAQELVNVALKDILTIGNDAQNIIGGLAGIRKGLLTKIHQLQKQIGDETYSTYKEGYSDALIAILKALDKKLGVLAEECDEKV